MSSLSRTGRIALGVTLLILGAVINDLMDPHAMTGMVIGIVGGIIAFASWLNVNEP